MMKTKQVLFDIGIVLALPILVFVGSYFWNSDNNTALLSLVAPPEESEFGARTNAVLDTLSSITMDSSLFDDPVYRSLQEFHVDVAPATLGRPYPFTPPDVLRNTAATKLR